ncbi:alpha/beta hydrolase [Puia sp. P3]|uniref:alpha/beta hydrolase n=1 Tax=Puia sp. P3 TaxID=3423952 RepID=UPI003D674EFF
MKKSFTRWAKVLVLLYCVVGIAWFYGQERLIFHPTTVDRKAKWNIAGPFRELNIPYDATTNINVLQLEADSPARGVVLYFHDSRGNNGDYVGVAPEFTAKGYQLWLIDYPGYGKSTGTLSEKRLYEQALIFYKLARSRWQPGQIVIYGQGLGTGIAAQLAAVRDCRRLILESPYSSMTSVMRRYFFLYPVKQMLHYHLPTNEYLKEVTAPVTVLEPGSAAFRQKLDSVISL